MCNVGYMCSTLCVKGEISVNYKNKIPPTTQNVVLRIILLRIYRNGSLKSPS